MPRDMRLAGVILGVCVGMSSSPVWAREVVDQSGYKVKIPDPLEHIVDLWFAHNETLLMLDGPGRIVATVNRPSIVPWMFYAFPDLYKARQVKGGMPNIEDLLRTHVQLVFVSSTNKLVASTLRKVGLAVVETGFTTVEELKRSVRLTADVLHTPQAKDKAEQYQAWLEEKLAFTSEKLEHDPSVPINRPKVLHIHSLHPLMVDGSQTLIDTWIKRAGGVNVATGSAGNMKPVSFEQVLVWNPDIIIVESGAGSLEDAPESPWHWLKAVQMGKVYTNPLGLFPWDRYSLEFPLQVLWAAKILHPDLFQNIDMHKECQDFYGHFFGIDFSPADISRILSAERPVSKAPAPHLLMRKPT